MNITPQVSIHNGTCHIFHAFDIAQSIDLAKAENLFTLTFQRASITPKHRAPKYFGYSVSPLRAIFQTTSIALLDFATDPQVEAVIYDFGAVSLNYRVPLSGNLDRLSALSEYLYENEDLLRHSKARMEEMIRTLEPAITKSYVADVVEDYHLFEIDAFEGNMNGRTILQSHGSFIAGILRAERRELSSQERSDALQSVISYTDDALALDWHAALLMDYEGDDVRLVLEFANVALLEMRFLDSQLDQALDQAYQALTREKQVSLFGLGKVERDLNRIAQLQVDAASLFEAVNNTLKLFGDQYLARVYQLAATRFSLTEWDLALSRKLHTLESIYGKISDRAVHKRMEAMEMAIIVLFIISIGISLYPGMGK